MSATVIHQIPTDIRITPRGATVEFQPLTPSAYDWIEANPKHTKVWIGTAFTVQACFAEAIMDQVMQAGLMLR